MLHIAETNRQGDADQPNPNANINKNASQTGKVMIFQLKECPRIIDRSTNNVNATLVSTRAEKMVDTGRMNRGKKNLRNQGRMLNKRVAGSDECGAEKRPTDESALHKNENRAFPRLDNTHYGTEDKREDPRRDERLENYPGHTQRGLTVPKVDVPDGQSGEEPAKIPELSEIETREASR
jgi:hypothetical protein